MRYILVMLLLVAIAPVASAQNKKADGPKPEKISASGTIEAIGPGYLQVVSQAGDRWQVAIDPKAEIMVTGTAAPSFLRAGMLVKFSGKFNKRAESVEPLRSLTIFTPKPVTPERRQGGEESDPEAAERAKLLFKIKEEAPETDKKKVKPPETYDISSAGAVMGMRGGKVQVRAPEGAFKIELADDAQLSIDVNDYRIAKAGDKIDLDGWGYASDKTKVVANRIVIRLSETLGETKKKAEAKEPEKKDVEKKEDGKKTTEKQE